MILYETGFIWNTGSTLSYRFRRLFFLRKGRRWTFLLLRPIFSRTYVYWINILLISNYNCSINKLYRRGAGAIQRLSAKLMAWTLFPSKRLKKMRQFSRPLPEQDVRNQIAFNLNAYSFVSIVSKKSSYSTLRFTTTF